MLTDVEDEFFEMNKSRADFEQLRCRGFDVDAKEQIILDCTDAFDDFVCPVEQIADVGFKTIEPALLIGQREAFQVQEPIEAAQRVSQRATRFRDIASAGVASKSVLAQCIAPVPAFSGDRAR